MRVTLGFDTSCYTTSCAMVSERGEVLGSSRKLLPVAPGERGLRQSEAVFAHVKQMPEVVSRLMAGVADDCEIVATCASVTPRDEEASYMPVFTVGAGHARTLADTLRVPMYTTSHQQGHIAAGLVGNTKPKGDFVALHLSGGTTETLLCAADGSISLVGGSLDLHAGQLVDRVGVALSLGFPAGAALEQLAMRCTESTEALLPVSMERDGLHCHLSGAETRAQQWIREESFSPERIAAEAFDLLGRTVARLIAGAAKQTDAREALIVGGVASSALLRTLVVQRLHKLRCPVRVMFGQPQYSADNAVGVARIGMEKYWNAQGGHAHGGATAGR